MDNKSSLLDKLFWRKQHLIIKRNKIIDKWYKLILPIYRVKLKQIDLEIDHIDYALNYEMTLEKKKLIRDATQKIKDLKNNDKRS